MTTPRGSDAARRVLRSYYGLAGMYTLAASIIWGVNTLFMLDAGLSILEVFIANGAFAAGMVIFEIPTGVVADTLGRRASFLFSVVVLALTTLAYAGLAQIGGDVVAFSAVSVVMGLGFTFYSGAVEAWLVDALHFVGYEGELDDIFARGQMITGAGMLVGTIGGGVLGTIDLALPYIARAALLVVLFVLAFSSMHDLGFTTHSLPARDLPAAMRRVGAAGVAFGWRQRPLRLLMLASLAQAGFLFWGFYAWQPYFLELLGREDAVWIAGVVSALVALSTIGGNVVVEWFTRFCGHRTTLLLWAAGMQFVAAVVVGLATSFWVALPGLLIITGAMGVAGPVRQAYVHHLIPSEQRATVVSFDSMVSGLGGTGGQAGLGALAQARSYSAGYIVGGASLVVALPLLWAVRRIGGAADAIVGSAAGVEGTCAADGLPAVAHVDSHPRKHVGA